MFLRLPAPDTAPQSAAAWTEVWQQFVQRIHLRHGSFADRREVEESAQYLVDVVFPTLLSREKDRSVCILMNLPDEAGTWPPESAYNQVRRLLLQRQAHSQTSCRTYREVELVDAAAAVGFDGDGQQTILCLSRDGALTLAEMRACNQWNDDELADFMARAALMTA